MQHNSRCGLHKSLYLTMHMHKQIVSNQWFVSIYKILKCSLTAPITALSYVSCWLKISFLAIGLSMSKSGSLFAPPTKIRLQNVIRTLGISKHIHDAISAAEYMYSHSTQHSCFACIPVYLTLWHCHSYIIKHFFLHCVQLYIVCGAFYLIASRATRSFTGPRADRNTQNLKEFSRGY